MDEFERGKLEGLRDAKVESHEQRLANINGSIDRFTAVVDALAKTVTAAVDHLASEIRTLQEQARSAALAVKVAADTLATETERRREELATTAASTQSTWSLRSSKMNVVYLAAAIVGIGFAIFFGLHP